MSISFWEVSSSSKNNLKNKEFNNPFDQNIDQDNTENNNSKITENTLHPKIEIIINDKSCNSNCINPCNICKPEVQKPVISTACKPCVTFEPTKCINKFDRCADLKCKLAHSEEKIKELQFWKSKLLEELSSKEALLQKLEERVFDIKQKLQNLKCD